MAYIAAEDAAKIPLQQYIGLPDVSGTAQTWTPPTNSTTQAIMADLLSGAGLTALQYDLQSGIDHSTYTLDSERISDALGKLAQRSNGFIYTNGKGQIVFNEGVATGGLGSTSEMALRDTNEVYGRC